AGINRKENPMHKTRNDIPEKVRVQVAALLQERLAEAIDFEAQTKQAHWNVKGPNFIALHELFDQVYEHAGEHADLIAERIVQLGGIAEGTVKAVAKRAQMPDYPLTLSSGREHVEALSRAIAWFGENIRKSIDQADEVNDRDTADLFTEVSRALDKDLWFVEAHLQAER